MFDEFELSDSKPKRHINNVIWGDRVAGEVNNNDHF
jgi:hypothetical protein